MLTWYCVHEKTSYQDIGPGLREDIGEYFVSECNADSVKELLIDGINYSKEYIKEYVFEDKQDAYIYALSLTIAKMQKVFNKISK